MINYFLLYFIHLNDLLYKTQANALRISVPQLPAWFLLSGFAQLRWVMSPGRQQHVQKSMA